MAVTEPQPDSRAAEGFERVDAILIRVLDVLFKAGARGELLWREIALIADALGESELVA